MAEKLVLFYCGKGEMEKAIEFLEQVSDKTPTLTQAIILGNAKNR